MYSTTWAMDGFHVTEWAAFIIQPLKQKFFDM